ncbi:MAG: BON domain-containing protein [Gammaproteobacteria bacterium]|nr:BON domain-containing protein [Gammaproteobacteria bacterium]
MTISNRWAWITVIVLALSASAACQKKTSVELTGARSEPSASEQAEKKMDDAAINTRTQTEKIGDKISDATITTKVKSAIIGEPGLKATQIEVDTVNGVVTLSGVVNAPQNADQAVRVAKTVEGVKSVNNKLSVKTSG